jgi:hypothetical protein
VGYQFHPGHRKTKAGKPGEQGDAMRRAVGDGPVCFGQTDRKVTVMVAVPRKHGALTPWFMLDNLAGRGP